MEAVGCLALFWQESQGQELAKGTKEQIMDCLPCPKPQREKCFNSLVANKFISRQRTRFLIHGNLTHIENLSKKRISGKLGGDSKARLYGKNNDLPPSIRLARATAGGSQPSPAQPSAVQPSPVQPSSAQRELPTSSAKDDAPMTHELLDIWNEFSGELPKAKGLNKNRMRLSRDRWRENSDPKYWEQVVTKISKSTFCCGKTGERGWVATFDWFIKPDTHLNVIEGKYDDRDKSGYYMTNERKRSHNNNLRMKEMTGKTIEELMNGPEERTAEPVESDL